MASNKLYVGNFPWSTTENELRELFEQYGALRSVKIVMDRETGRSRGFAFIEFEDAAACQDAMESENGRDMGGRELKVREAIDKPRENREPREQRPSRPPPDRTAAPPPAERSSGGKRHRERPSRRDSERDYE